MAIWRRQALVAASGVVALTSAASVGVAQERVVNVYSARHHDADQQLYQQFTEQTGAKVNLIEGDADQLIERIKAEGANSPADVLITVDAGRLHRAVEAGLLSPVDWQVLEDLSDDEREMLELIARVQAGDADVARHLAASLVHERVLVAFLGATLTLAQALGRLDLHLPQRNSATPAAAIAH